HTMSSANVFEVALNGTKVCEAELSAYIAGHFGVPIMMISGDDAVCEEVTKTLPQCARAVVKQAISYHSADSLTPNDAIEVLRATTRQAVQRRGEMQPVALAGPVSMDLTFKNHRPT